MLNMPILSIIVPSYNMEKYLPKCLGSLIVAPEQMEKLEVLVVNDGSKDRTSEIAHEFAAKWPGTFKVIDKENGHYGSCINAGLEVATGAYVRVLDADDWFNTENFSEYLEFLDEVSTKSPDLIVSDFNSHMRRGIFAHTYPDVPEAVVSLDEFNQVNRKPLQMHAVAYRTENLRAIEYRQIEGMIHTDLQWLNLPMTTVSRVARFPKVIYEYLECRPGNTSNEIEYYRTYYIQEKILMQLMCEYQRVRGSISDAQDEYLRSFYRYRASRAYYLHLRERNKHLKNETLVELDAFLRENARWLYCEMGEFVFSNKVRFHYVSAWRKHQKMTCELRFTLSLLDVLQSAYAFLLGVIK